MRTSSNILAELDLRRRELHMPVSVLAKRSGVAFRTVQRIIGGHHDKATWATVIALAQALGLDLELRSVVDAESLRERQARTKADRLMRMVQGTAALEAQAVDPNKYQQMIRRTVHEILAGPARKLWAE